MVLFKCLPNNTDIRSSLCGRQKNTHLGKAFPLEGGKAGAGRTVSQAQTLKGPQWVTATLLLPKGAVRDESL